MVEHKRAFKEILKEIGPKNSECLMKKARLANRLAKKSNGRNRRNAYRVKSDALCSLVQKLPGNVRISRNFRLTDFIIVGLNGEYSGLHLPVAALPSANQ